MTPHDEIATITAKGFGMTLTDAVDLDYLTTQIPWEDACRVLDSVRLVINDPIYQGDIPANYFDDED